MLLRSIAIVLSIVFLLSCGGDPAGVTSPISVTSPSSSTIWKHYQMNATIEWDGGSTENVSISLYRGANELVVLDSSAPNTGIFILPDMVPTSWSSGSDYSVRISDGLGETGNSPQFSVEEVEGEEVFTFSEPGSGTVWYWLDSDLLMNWTTDYSSGKEQNGREQNQTSLGYENVKLELWNGGNKVTDLSDWTSNTGSFTYQGEIPFSWGHGSDFTVRIFDENGNYGLSPVFEISDSEFEIVVSKPNFNTIWYTGQVSTQVMWGESPGSQIKIEVWKAGSYLADFSGWTVNDGDYTRSSEIPESWSTGDDYSIRVVDDLGYEGFSCSFQIIDSPTEGLVAYWPLDGNGNDESGNGHDGTIYGASATQDRFGNPNSAMSFDGNDDVMEVEDFREWQDGLSITAWFRINGWTSENGPVMEKHGEFNLIVKNGSISFYIANGSSLSGSYSTPTGEWTHVAATWNGSVRALYVNGNCITSGSFPGPIANSEYPVYIASDEVGISHYFWGTMDDVRMYDRALGYSEIQALYHEGGWQ